LDGYEVKVPSSAPVEKIAPDAVSQGYRPPPKRRRSKPDNPNAGEALRRKWQEPEFRAKMARIRSKAQRRKWRDPEYRAKMIAIAKQPKRKRQPEAIHHAVIERLIALAENGLAIPPELTKALSGVKTKLPEYLRWRRRQRWHHLAGTIEFREKRRRYGQAQRERERVLLDALHELGWIRGSEGCDRRNAIEARETIR
jgi:hypothetical protein